MAFMAIAGRGLKLVLMLLGFLTAAHVIGEVLHAEKWIELFRDTVEIIAVFAYLKGHKH